MHDCVFDPRQRQRHLSAWRSAAGKCGLVAFSDPGYNPELSEPKQRCVNDILHHNIEIRFMKCNRIKSFAFRNRQRWLAFLTRLKVIQLFWSQKSTDFEFVVQVTEAVLNSKTTQLEIEKLHIYQEISSSQLYGMTRFNKRLKVCSDAAVA